MRGIDDLRLLADIIGVESADTALQICVDFYLDEPAAVESATGQPTRQASRNPTPLLDTRHGKTLRRP